MSFLIVAVFFFFNGGAVDHKCSIMVFDSQCLKSTPPHEKEQEQIHVREAIKSHRDPSQVRYIYID